MKKMSIGLVALLALALSAFAQPYTFMVNNFTSDGSVFYTAMYDGSAVPVNNLIQVIRVGTNGVGTIDAPNATAGSIGAVAGDDLLNSTFGMGEGTTPDPGWFSATLTAFPSATGNAPNSLIANTQFYLRVWADVALGASVPFATGSHYFDIGPLTVPPQGNPDIYDLQIGTWSTCGTAVVPPAINVTGTATFGNVTIGSTGTQTFTISNTGGSALTISNVATTGAFSNSAVPGSIAAGSSADVTLTFTPVAAGAANGTFSFDHNAAGGSYSVNLSGTGVVPAAPAISVDPATIVMFGNVTTGGSFADMNVVISNTGNADLTLSNFAVTGDFAIQVAAGATVAGGSSTTATLRFTPTVAGTRNGTFTFDHNATGGSYSLNLEGTGVVPNPWTGGHENNGNNPNPGSNPNPWAPNFPNDPTTGGNPPIGLNFAGGIGNQPSSIVVLYTPAAPGGLPGTIPHFGGGSDPFNPALAVGRYWDIQQTGGTGFNATVSLFFTDNELPAGMVDPRIASPRLMALAYNTTTLSWTVYYPIIDLYQAGTPNVWRAQIFSVSGFSIWSLTPQYVTPVTGLTFSATGADNSVNLRWHVESETGVGFYRIDRRLAGTNGEWAQVAMVDGHENSATALTYFYTDRGVVNGNTYEYRIADVSSFDGTTIYHNNVVNARPVAPVVSEYALSNYPNPFNPETRIAYTMKAEGNVKLTVTNIMGQTIATLVNGKMGVGTHVATWNAANMPSGIYFLNMEAGNYNTMRKMVLSK